MPWKEIVVVQQRESFIRDWLRRSESLSALCERYGIARKTGGKWVQRFRDGGMPALVDRSRRPRRVAHAVAVEVADAVVALRKRHPLWGPKKLRAHLQEQQPSVPWPSASTMGVILKQNGLIAERRRRPRTPYPTQPLTHATEPNVLWCTDFKGSFRVGGRYCHPLTLTDAYSRKLLRLEAVDAESFECVKPIYESAFKEFGLPLRIRSDNGSPFASRAVGGLSRLSVWWVKLGITPERIVPGHPEQNGRHERMHRTLKAHTARPAKPSAEEQSRAFIEFQRHYNSERPHEALGQKTPDSAYTPSYRKFPEELSDPDYPEDFELRRLNKNGRLKFLGGETVLSNVLAEEAIGLEPVDDGRWQLWFGPIYLGLLSQQEKGKLEVVRNTPK